MKLKHLLTLAALTIGGGNLWAQTDVTSTYLTNADFEGTYTNKISNSSGSNLRYVREPNGWTLAYSNGCEWDASILSSSDELYNSISSKITIPSNGRGNQTYAVRLHGNAKNSQITLVQENSFPKGKYTLTGSFYTQNQNEIEAGFFLGATYSNDNRTKYTAGNEAWKNLTIYFESDGSTAQFIGVFFKHTSGNAMIAGVDNITLGYENVNGSILNNLIQKATNINAKLNNSTLETTITTAQGIYNGINNTPDYQDDIDGAISDLQSAITTAVSAYSYNPAGDDVSALLLDNPGFDIDINFSSSSSDATAANTIYSTFGWTPTVPGNCTGATMGYGYSGNINGSGNVTAPTKNADETTAGGALIMCVGWSGEVTYKSVAKTFPAGSYRITYRAYNGNTKNTTAVEAIPLVGFVPTSGGSQINSTTETFTNQAWSTHTYDFELSSDTEGQIQIGLQPTSNTNSYNAPELFIDEVKLTYFDPLKLAQIQWQAVHDALAALDATALPDAAESAITVALAETEPTTVEGYNTAKAALQALIDSYDGIKAAYNKLSALITLATNEKDNSTGTKDDIESAISTANSNIETRTTAADLTNDYNTLEEARETYVTGGAEPADGYPFDYTFKLSNPSFEEGTTGWTLDKNTTGQWNYGKAQNNPVDGIYNLDAWAPQINYINVYQSVTLGTGSYSLKGSLYSSDLKAQHIYANNGTDYPSANLASSASWEQLAANFFQTGESSVKLGIYSQGNNVNGDTKGWFRADHFQLFFNGVKPLRKEQLLAVITSANTLYNSGANVGTGVFQILVAAGTAFSGAISDASDVYNNPDASVSEITDAITALEGAIETFNAAELNAPVDGARYRIKSTASNVGWKDKYYMLRPDASQANGGYSTKADVSAADYLAIAWKFTAVTGGYTLSMTDAEGATRYLCTNIKGYGQGSATQIRTTTNSEKALVVKVIAATGTDGRWFLQNTEDNSYLGGQDAGLFSNSQNYDLAIEEASQASVSVKIDPNKYATRIFPFTPSAIDGVTFYSCTAAENGELTLVEVATPEANVPYILHTSKDVDVTLEGWGTASTTEYTAGWLTGEYAEKEITSGYVLQTLNGEQKFYAVDAADAITVPAYRAYLNASTSGGVKAFGFPGALPTGIETVDNGQLTMGRVYNLAGQRVQKAQRSAQGDASHLKKGLYIVGGKKVLVK